MNPALLEGGVASPRGLSCLPVDKCSLAYRQTEHRLAIQLAARFKGSPPQLSVS